MGNTCMKVVVVVTVMMMVVVMDSTTYWLTMCQALCQVLSWFISLSPHNPLHCQVSSGVGILALICLTSEFMLLVTMSSLP